MIEVKLPFCKRGETRVGVNSPTKFYMNKRVKIKTNKIQRQQSLIYFQNKTFYVINKNIREIIEIIIEKFLIQYPNYFN